jgi:hypothetical protein
LRPTSPPDPAGVLKIDPVADPVTDREESLE